LIPTTSFTILSIQQRRPCSDREKHDTSSYYFRIYGAVHLQKNEAEKPKKRKRREKVNKYSKFSKTKADKDDKDPLDLLIEESNKKNLELERQKQEKRNRRPRDPRLNSNENKRQRNKMTFPPLPTIDPYDPTTYGFTELGTIIGVHGVKGLVRLKSATDFGDVRLCRSGIRHLKMPNRRSPREIYLHSGRKVMSDEYLVELDGVDDRDAALKLRGAVLYAREEDKSEILDDIGEDEWMVEDLVGLSVFLEENPTQKVARVSGIVFGEDMGFFSDVGIVNDYLEILLEKNDGGMNKEMVLIPFVPQIVPVVDVEGGSIIIDPPPGLLDLTYVRQEKVRIKGLLPPAKD